MAFPIFYPNGGNPLHAQGIYPHPCYLVYDPHIKAMKDEDAFKKTGKDFVKQRVMKFGSKLTPAMIWKNGLLRCEELAQQWSMKLGSNFRPMLAQTLLGFLEKEQELIPKKDTLLAYL